MPSNVDSQGQAGALSQGEVIITPAMEAAGARVLEDERLYFTEEVLASKVYRAMELARHRAIILVTKHAF